MRTYVALTVAVVAPGALWQRRVSALQSTAWRVAVKDHMARKFALAHICSSDSCCHGSRWGAAAARQCSTAWQLAAKDHMTREFALEHILMSYVAVCKCHYLP